MNSVSEDRFLGGRVFVRQPTQGFRSGLDAVMLAAAIAVDGHQLVLELGSGAGVASLCLAARAASCFVTGIDIQADLVRLANENARDNGVSSRVHFVEGDALDPPKELRRSYDHVFVNPPFHDDAGEASPAHRRALALQDGGRFGDWLASGLKRVRSQGTFSAIVRADRLGALLAQMPARGVTLFPLWPRSGEPAKRVIVQARKDSRAPLLLSQGLVLHEADGGYTPAAEAILGNGGSLALARPRL